MDDGRGRFVPLATDHAAIPERRTSLAGVFAVGDEVELRGSRFRVHEIWPQRLVLKLLPRDCGGGPEED